MISQTAPVGAFAQFFDDIRQEVGGKLTLVGQYIGDLYLNQAGQPTDRLAVLLTLSWARDFYPTSFNFRIEVTGQPPMIQDMGVPPQPKFGDQPSSSAFSKVMTQAAINLRFPPLRAGDVIDVWCRIDDADYPAGRLRITAPQEQRSTEPITAAVI